MEFTLQAYLKQPSTILGIAGFVATTAGIVAHMLTHDTTLAVGAAGIAGSAVHVLLPDNSAAASSVEKLVTDAVQAAAEKRLAQAMPLLVADGLAALDVLKPAGVAPTPG